MVLTAAHEQILERLRDTPFILTLSGRSGAPGGLQRELALPEPPRKVVARTLVLHDRPHVQINAYTQKQHFTKNFPLGESPLDSVLSLLLEEPFTQAHIQTPDGDLYVRSVVKGGTPTISTTTTPPSKGKWEDDRHDSEKQYPVTPQNSAELLRALGITGGNDAVRSAMQAKYRQINHFVSIALQLDIVQAGGPLRIVDCGCGKAYLSLALYHALANVLGRKVELVGIDTNAQVIDFCNRTARTLHFDNASFRCMPISSFQPQQDADLVIALHACDTATDDALALALRMNAQAILAAPCCHHYVNSRLRAASAPDDVAVLLQDGITRERLADLLTDSMRRDILKAYGYSASLMEFVSPEHTTKNILIRAEHPLRPSAPDQMRLQRVRDEIQRWNAGPKLMECIGHGTPHYTDDR